MTLVYPSLDSTKSYSYYGSLLLGVVCSYKIIMDDGQGGPLRKVFEGGATSHKAVKLRPASSYRVAVQVRSLLHAFNGEPSIEKRLPL